MIAAIYLLLQKAHLLAYINRAHTIKQLDGTWVSHKTLLVLNSYEEMLLVLYHPERTFNKWKRYSYSLYSRKQTSLQRIIAYFSPSLRLNPT